MNSIERAQLWFEPRGSGANWLAQLDKGYLREETLRIREELWNGATNGSQDLYLGDGVVTWSESSWSARRSAVLSGSSTTS